MSLIRIDLPLEPAKLPYHVQVLLDETADALVEWQDGKEHSFVPADYVLVFDALCALRRQQPGRERHFVEWGSGLGIATLMATALGWKGQGIELQSGLVLESRRLARVFGLPARFHHGNFFPGETQSLPKLADICSRADLVYVYPWPDHELEIFDLFDRLARPGARLLAYLGIEDIRVFEKCGCS